MNTKILTGFIFSEMLKQGSLNLKINKKTVNDLNVFPIPDGDTGDNMYMTISSGVNSLMGKETEALSDVAKNAADGMLFGARGNSGVILSRIFAGISDGFIGYDEADISQVAKAFSQGVDNSYRAVTTPVEGTILTVFKDSTNYANSRITSESTLESYFDDFSKELKESLERTPELLQVLKDAGVVDSGGAGLLYITSGMKNCLSGEKIIDTQEEESVKTPSEEIDFDKFGPNSVLEFGYCTEFLLRLQNGKTDIENFDLNAFIDYLNSMGNSVVCFRNGSVVKVHVHTFNPGLVLEHCRMFGEFLTVKIENMTLQHNNSTVKNNYNPDEDTSFFRKDVRKKYGIVAVAAGEGIKSMFSEICVDEVVDGGQSMNPSAENLVDAFKKINADTIFVLPNNGNIVLTAKQAALLYKESDIRIIETHTIGEGYAVVSMMDLSMDTPEEIEEAAKEAMEGVVTGFISKATRDAEKDGVKISAGDYIGFEGSRICCSCSSKEEAALELSKKTDAEDKAVLLLIRGKDTTEEECSKTLSVLSGNFPDIEIIPIEGKQPIYDFILVYE